MKYTIGQLAKILHLSQHIKHAQREISQLLTDSRRLIHPHETLFIALSSNRQDGHQYIPELYKNGVRAFLTNQNFDPSPYPDADFFQVSHPLKSLQFIVETWRNKFSIPLIGITGSNGKTIVKEWLFQLLKSDYHIIRSPKSFNSQIGVPLSVAEINKDHNLAIFEAGISRTGEMDRLQKIIHPNIGIFTNIGEAHSEGFTDIKQKIREKLKLFTNTQCLIFCKDDALLEQEIHRFQKKQNTAHQQLKLFSWSKKKSQSAQLQIIHIHREEKKRPQPNSQIEAIYKNQKLAISFPFTDNGSIENAIHCLCTLLYLGINPKDLSARFEKLQPVAMRLEMKTGIQNCQLINDSYNSDFASIKVALDFLVHQKQRDKHTLILSDIEQAGTAEKVLYQKLAHLLEAKKIDRFIGIGDALFRQRQLFENLPEVSFYPSTPKLIKAIKTSSVHSLFLNEVILLKGARSFTFEKIVKLLEQKKHQNELTINLNAVVHNLKTYQSLLDPKVKTMVMVKAFSYGSGSAEIASLLQFHRVDYLAVANIEEGIYLRKNGITLPILILNPDPFYFEELIEWELEPELYSFTIFDEFAQKAASMGLTHCAVHIKLDTGMHRLGFTKEQLPQLITTIKHAPHLKIASIFSHLAASENPEMDYFTKIQGELFDQMSTVITGELSYPVIKHLSNTSGISRHPNLQFNMVRLGIGLYGIDAAMENKLETVHTLKATIAQIKSIPPGDTVGYGRAGKVKTPTRIAIVTLGYADGYLRSLGLGKGKMLIHQKHAPTIGQICMDMLMLDITSIPNAKVGDEVIVFGADLKIEKVASSGHTIPYEILSGLSQRIIRVYTQE